jgi:hypothetical protein
MKNRSIGTLPTGLLLVKANTDLILAVPFNFSKIGCFAALRGDMNFNKNVSAPIVGHSIQQVNALEAEFLVIHSVNTDPTFVVDLINRARQS